jgi:glycerol-3-phosphate dehydrogenase
VSDETYDILIIGGGINGACIARDAAGRGLSVFLCEKGDLGGATSSASSKLIHGGLRYLEYFAIRLVREALLERETLLATAPHIVRPLRFVLPHAPGLRPVWMIRAGLWLYDFLSTRHRLARSETVRLSESAYSAGLAETFDTGFLYSDCWVDDARFVVLTALDAAEHGAVIRTRTRCVEARRADAGWRVTLETADGREEMGARVLVNAAGPWVEHVIREVAGVTSPAHARLIKGSHIVVPRLYDGEHAFILQNDDGRVVFVIPFEEDFSLIGTTDIAFEGDPGNVEISDDETDYLCRAVNRYFSRATSSDDVVWNYAGVRPLYDDGKGDPSAVTRDYVLALDAPKGEAPLLSVFGGKITTARKLAEKVLRRLKRHLPAMGRTWTAKAPLPGGDTGPYDRFFTILRRSYPDLDVNWLAGLARRHGTRVHAILDGVKSMEDLEVHLGGGLYAREFAWLIREEWAQEPDDVLWRRTKAGLRMTPQQREAVAAYMARMRSG